MFLGHYGLAFGAKRIAPSVSLGWLTFSAQFADELWPILLLLGAEQVRIVPGLMAANDLDFVSYPISHSLLLAIVWGFVIGGIYYLLRRSSGGYYAMQHSRRHAVIIGLLVVSHWFLDLLVHRPDLPLIPGLNVRVGLGLWNSVPATLALEFGLFFGGLVLYLTSTRARDRIGSYGLWTMVVVLVVAYLANTFGPTPDDPRAIAKGALLLWLFVPWSWWVDSHRQTRETPTGRRY